MTNSTAKFIRENTDDNQQVDLTISSTYPGLPSNNNDNYATNSNYIAAFLTIYDYL